MQILGEGILFDKKELRLTICRGHWISQWVVFEKKSHKYVYTMPLSNV